MATVTCPGAGCGTELGPADLLCPSCGRPRPRTASLSDEGRTSPPAPAATPTDDSPPDRGTAAGRFRLVSPWGEFRLEHSETDIGREVGPFADELAGHPTVSRRHATLRITSSGRLHVIDHGSSNGTFKNDRRIEPNVPVELDDGDTVSFSTRLRLDVRTDGEAS